MLPVERPLQLDRALGTLSDLRCGQWGSWHSVLVEILGKSEHVAESLVAYRGKQLELGLEACSGQHGWNRLVVSLPRQRGLEIQVPLVELTKKLCWKRWKPLSL